MTDQSAAPAAVGSRFAQLTFASADRTDGTGGWQVQEIRGELAAAEQSFLVDGIMPRLPDGEPAPLFPSAAEIARLPRRLVYGVRDGIGGAWWHTAPCGADSQGRPGNVFVHVILDREADGPRGGPLRPSDLIGRAAGWLRPYGHAEVVTASLAAVPGLAWPPSPDRARVLTFLRDPSLSVGALCVLLDAVYAALSGGRGVVLGVRDLSRAGDWLAAVCHLMSPATARRLTWSTWARAGELAARPPAAHLTVVPYDDVPALGDRVVAVREDEPHPPAGWGDPPRFTRSGARVEVTSWSELFYEVSSPTLLPAVLAEADRVAVEAGDARLDPAWPLAMAVAMRADEFRDALPAARAVLEAHGPSPLGATRPRLYQHVIDLVGEQTGPGLGAAWSAVLASDEAHAAVRTDLFLLRALADPTWRDVTGPVDQLRPPGPVSVVVRETAVTALDALAARAEQRGTDGAGGEGAVALAADTVRLGELLRLAHIDLGPRLPESYDQVVLPVLLDPVGGVRLARALPGLGAVRADVAARVARALPRRGGEPGTRLAPEVLRLLGTRLPHPDDLGPGRPDPLEGELAAQLTLVDPDPRARSWLVCVWAGLDALGSASVDAALDALLDLGRDARYRRGPVGWDGFSLAVLMAHPQAHRMRGAVVAALLGLAPGPEADALTAAARAHLAAGAEDAMLVAALRTRELAAGPTGREILDVAAAVLPVGGVHPEIRQAVLAACLGEGVRAAWERTAPGTAVSVPVLDVAQAAGRDPAERDRVARLLAVDPTVSGVALTHAAVLLRRGGADEAAWAELRRVLALIPDDGHGSPIAHAAALRVRDGQITGAELDAVRLRLREAPRTGRGRPRRMFGDRGADPDEVALWWQEIDAPLVIPREGTAR